MVKEGDEILILEMSGEPSYSGRTGVVTRIDDAGQIHGTWGGLALLPDLDIFLVVKEQENG